MTVDDVRLVRLHLPKHGPHSGYDRLADFLPGARVLRPPELPIADPVRHPGCARILRAAWPGSWYSLDAFVAEAAGLTRSLVAPGGLYHYLYGERQVWLATLPAGRPRGKVVATFHQTGDWLERAVRRPDRLRRLDAVVVVSRSQVPDYSRYVDQSRIHVVPHGVDTAFFRPPEGLEPAGGADRTAVCLTVAEWLRDFDTLERVIALLRGGTTRISFVIVSRSPQAQLLRRHAGVTVLSDISEADLVRRYQRADLLLLPLHDSTANNVLLESLSCGTPVVATGVGGVPEYLDESCGVITPPGDADAMAAAVVALLEDRERLRLLSRAARRHALRFGWDQVAEATRRVYEHILRN
jgi:glycosyltransferase involved in cell wall biosynthesis